MSYVSYVCMYVSYVCVVCRIESESRRSQVAVVDLEDPQNTRTTPNHNLVCSPQSTVSHSVVIPFHSQSVSQSVGQSVSHSQS